MCSYAVNKVRCRMLNDPEMNNELGILTLILIKPDLPVS